MPDPKVRYPSITTFGGRTEMQKVDKEAVANRVVQRFLTSGTSVFIGDGSSTFPVGLRMFEQNLQSTIWTNHLAIAHEFPLWASASSTDLRRTSVWLAGGEVDRDLMMTCGDDADTFAEKWAKKAQYIILSVRCLFSEQGPAGMEQKSLSIKQAAARAALQTGGKLIFIADHDKLSKGYTNEPLVFPAASDWAQALENPAVYVVTTQPPGLPEKKLVARPQNALEWYQHHQWKLGAAMHNRFIEVT